MSQIFHDCMIHWIPNTWLVYKYKPGILSKTWHTKVAFFQSNLLRKSPPILSTMIVRLVVVDVCHYEGTASSPAVRQGVRALAFPQCLSCVCLSFLMFLHNSVQWLNFGGWEFSERKCRWPSKMTWSIPTIRKPVADKPSQSRQQ